MLAFVPIDSLIMVLWKVEFTKKKQPKSKNTTQANIHPNYWLLAERLCLSVIILFSCFF